MVSSPRFRENPNPNATTTITSESARPYPTTFVQADTSSFKQVVQMLTGSNPTNTQPDPTPKPSPHAIPPIKSNPKQQNSSGFRLYERRIPLKNNLNISPLNPANPGFNPTRKPEILSPSILDFPALVLSPVTPLIPDPFDRSGSADNNQEPNNGINANNADLSLDKDAEEKAIKGKGFYLHPSPSTTPRDSEPRLLPLFPVTSPRVSGSSTAASNS